MARHLPLDGRGAGLLDVGCGNGALVREATSWGWNAEGLDPDPNAAAFGQQFGLRIFTGGLQQTSYPDKLFAAVTMDHAIEHLHAPAASLCEAYRILKPGGVIWIATPNLSSIGQDRFRAAWVGLEPPRHLVLFTPQALISALRGTGFEKIERMRTPFYARWFFRELSSSKRSKPVVLNGSRDGERLLPIGGHSCNLDWARS